MQQAIQLAARGLYSASPNPRVGCLLVKSEQVIGRGWHRQAGLEHAEIEALNNCSQDPRDATAYVTLEPCSHQGKTPPCADALIKAGVSRVVVGSVDPNPLVSGSGIQKLSDAGIEVQFGCESADCDNLNPGFLSRMRHHRPWVRVKLACSLDARTALANGQSQWITGEAARADVQHWRARADAILTGIGTVLQDNPRLTVRMPIEDYKRYGYGAPVQPLLAVADSTLRTPENALLFDADRSVVIYTKNNPLAYDASCEIVVDQTVADQTVAGRAVADQAVVNECSETGIDPAFLLSDLGSKEINEVHVEAGAALCASLINAQLVDELLLYIAPHLLGSDARSLFSLGGISCMQDRVEFEFVDVAQVGTDLRLRLRPATDSGHGAGSGSDQHASAP